MKQKSEKCRGDFLEACHICGPGEQRGVLASFPLAWVLAIAQPAALGQKASVLAAHYGHLGHVNSY